MLWYPRWKQCRFAASPRASRHHLRDVGRVNLARWRSGITCSALAERETSFATPDLLQFVVIVEKSYCRLLTNLVEVTTAEGTTGVYTETSAILEYCIYLPVFLKDSD
jgi:hypothetical protein